ncbi:hypothetical protein NLX71_07575 [Paenibacillus sp. MZ04-78.2]|uniref:hypothetical protein n=1 Tax=Paenibacillus sp. MZ04-78.2 TaxID=2962034 RepID=UPI0020B7C9DB|nr:hypothetical protein [Paenibacillus sp. MZ04-78.2]MCP3773179.1 hypothetical protein [Paenibacillus sp. MZ04-78.2]
MGQRANLVITKQGGYDLYYNHWCANTLPRDLFWGPQHAISFIEAQAKVDETDWLNDIWAEGGVVLDAEKKLLLFFGGEEELYNIPYRRIFLSLMQKVWEEWDLRWANEGIIDIAEYVGVPREVVLASEDDDLVDISLAPPEAKDWIDTIISITFDEETLIFPLYGNIEGFLLHGPKVLQSCDRSFGFTEFRVGDWTTDFPSSGLHLDFKNKQIDMWHADFFPNVIQRMKELWPNWEVREHYDHYEVHIEKTAGRLHFQEIDRNKMLVEITSSLLRTPVNPLDTLSSLVKRLQRDGKEVSVNEFAYMHGNINLPEKIRESIIQYAISALEKDVY